MQLPADPILLYGVVNTKLRDTYASLEALCDDLDIDRASLEARLEAAGFVYQPDFNQFR